MADEYPHPEREEVSAQSSSPSQTASPSSSLPSHFSSDKLSDEFSGFDLLPGCDVSGSAIDAGKYEHQDLDPSVSQIRLIEILPTGEASGVCCRSSVHNLSDEPQYVALSYAWGSPPAQHIIQLDGKEFLVRKNLLRFLKHAGGQRPFAGALFWIDAICINQSNPNERTHQVNMMPQIYKGAQKVIAWLGPAYKSSNTVMDFLSTLRLTKCSKSRMNSIWSSACGQALAELCARSYWTRLWIFQELLLSRQTFLMCGDRLLELEIFHMLLSSACAATSRPRTKDRLAYRNTVESPAVTIAKQVAGQKVGGDGSLWSLILATRNLSCADFRDKVYALLGVAVEGHGCIVADYSVPVQVLSSCVLREHHRLRIPEDLDEVSMQLNELCRCFETDVDTLLELHEHYDGVFEIPTDYSLDAILTLLIPRARVFLWAAYYHHEAVLQLVLEDDDSRESILSALKIMVNHHNPTGIKVFLEIDAHVEFLGQEAKNRALKDAAGIGSHEMVEMLIVLGKAEVDQDDWDDRPLIYRPISRGLTDIVKTFLKFTRMDLNLPDEFGKTPLHMACASGHSEIVQLLLAMEGIEINSRQQGGRTALQEAIVMGHVEAVELLIGCPSIDVNMQDRHGRTALHLASTKEKPHIAQALLAHEQLDTNIQQYEHGSTALHLALRAQRWATVEAILNVEGADINIAGYDHATALHMAVEMNVIKAVEVLLRNPRVDFNAQKASQGTALHLAAQAGHLDILYVLLRDDRIDVNILGAQGRSTALHLASFSGRLGTVQELLKHPKVNVDIQNSKGHTALHVAEDVEIVEALTRRGAEINLQAEDGRTPLHMALWAGPAREPISMYLLSTGKVQVNLADERGYTPLYIACVQGNLEAVKALLKYPDLDVDRRYDGRLPAVKVAAQRQFPRIVEALTNSGKVEASLYGRVK